MTAPFGRRLCKVSENRASGGYRLFSLVDPDGPEPLPGQFYMLATESHWEQSGQRPYLPRALSVAETGPAAGGVRLDFLIEGIGPGTDRLCELAPGETVALVGETGAGKSTVVKLVARFYDPSSGTVSVDGHDLRELSLTDLRRNVTAVLQETLVFDGTVADNIRYGKPDATDQEITTAAITADAFANAGIDAKGFAGASGARAGVDPGECTFGGCNQDEPGRKRRNDTECRHVALQHGRLLFRDHEVAGRMAGFVDHVRDLMRRALNRS